ncbi:MAG: CBS domain-containing protein [Patescibacteria group bacterium]|nr:CBS domain-containing protein [Patescibacteria group bacterium]
MKVKDIMTNNVVTCDVTTPVNSVANKLVDNHITGMPVMDGEKIVGIITEADLIMQKAKIQIPQYIQILDSYLYLEDPSEVETELKKITGMTAKEVMTSKPITIKSNGSVSDLATLIEENHINPIPVVDNDKLVGIVSRADIVKLLARG